MNKYPKSIMPRQYWLWEAIEQMADEPEWKEEANKRLMLIERGGGGSAFYVSNLAREKGPFCDAWRLRAKLLELCS